jgi:SAM-dependent methyltransferase
MLSADDPIALCVAGRISPEVALARLLLAGSSPDEITRRLARTILTGRTGNDAIHFASKSVRAVALAQLLSGHWDRIEQLARMLAEWGLDHSVTPARPEAVLARTRASYDRAVASSPEAAVAAYSLGDPAILAIATAEVTDWLAREGLIGPEYDILDLGCGFGRVAAPLAARCRSVLGVDLSSGMIAEARRRCTAPNLRFEVTGGCDLSGLPAASFDLVLAVDSFPYLIQLGQVVTEAHVADAARLLRPGGALAVLNLSYRGDLEVDRADAARWASSHGFQVTRDGEAPFALWDGVAFVLRK